MSALTKITDDAALEMNDAGNNTHGGDSGVTIKPDDLVGDYRSYAGLPLSAQGRKSDHNNGPQQFHAFGRTPNTQTNRTAAGEIDINKNGKADALAQSSGDGCTSNFQTK